MALFALVLSSPYAIPVNWHSFARALNLVPAENPGFLPSPLINQTWYVVFGSIALFIPAMLLSLRRPLPGADKLIAVSALVWFGVTGLRALFTPGIQWSYMEVFLQAAFLLVFLACLTTGCTSRAISRFQILGALIAIPLACLALVQNAGFDPLPYSSTMPGSLDAVHGKHVVASTFGHPNYMGSYLAPLIVLALPLLLAGQQIVVRVLSAVSISMAVSALLVGGTRGPLVALAVGGVVFFLFLRREKVQWRRAILLFAAAVCAFGVSVLALPFLRPGFDIGDRLLGSKEIASRAFYWRVGLYAVADNPVFGIGPGQFDRLFWQNILKTPDTAPGGSWHFVLASVIRGVRPGQMHNDHLQVLVETGLIGAAAWGAFWAAIVRSAIKLRSALAGRADITRNAAVCGAMAVVFVDAQFGFPLHLPCSGVLFWLVVGMYATWKPQCNVLETHEPSS